MCGIYIRFAVVSRGLAEVFLRTEAGLLKPYTVYMGAHPLKLLMYIASHLIHACMRGISSSELAIASRQLVHACMRIKGRGAC